MKIIDTRTLCRCWFFASLLFFFCAETIYFTCFHSLCMLRVWIYRFWNVYKCNFCLPIYDFGLALYDWCYLGLVLFSLCLFKLVLFAFSFYDDPYRPMEPFRKPIGVVDHCISFYDWSACKCFCLLFFFSAVLFRTVWNCSYDTTQQHCTMHHDESPNFQNKWNEMTRIFSFIIYSIMLTLIAPRKRHINKP